MTSATAYRLFAAAALFCASLVFAVLVSAGIETYSIRVHAPPLPSENILGVSIPYVAPATIASYDPQSRIMVVYTKNAIANQVIPMAVVLDKDAAIMRQNAVIEDGIVVGVEPKRPATIEELKPGTRALAAFRLDADTGATSVTYLLIGDPFPRP